MYNDASSVTAGNCNRLACPLGLQGGSETKPTAPQTANTAVQKIV